jgi:hypothetical protein
MQDIKLYMGDFLEDISDYQAYDAKGVADGVSKFIWSMGDLEADLPKIGEYFGRTLYDMEDLQLIKMNDLVWMNPKPSEDDLVMPDINFKIVGHYLKTFQKATNDWREVVKHYRIARIHTIIDKTTEHIMQDKEDILNDLKSELGEVYEYVIMKLIAGEQPDHAEMLK